MSVPYEEMDIPEEEEEIHPLLGYLDDGNLALELKVGGEEASEILELYNTAKLSMDPWLKKYKRAINLAKLQAMSGDTEITEKNFPFEGASLAMMPYILEAMLDFNARTAPELAWADELVHMHVYGENTEEKEDRAKRTADYQNYQLKESIPDWQMDQDKGLLTLAATGTIYKKTYFDHDVSEVRSDLCLAEDIIFNHNYKSFAVAPDKFQKVKYSRNEVLTFIRGEQEWEIAETELEEKRDDFEFIEAYTWLDLDDDGMKEPYVATIWEEKERIVALYPCFDEDTLTTNEDGEVIKISAVDKFTPIYFLPDPEGGPMGLGWGILLGPMFDGINTTVRQLIDSGTLSIVSANSGLISQSLATGRGNAAQAGPIELRLGQLTPVSNHGSGSLRDSVVQFPFAGPSTVLMALMESLITASRSMTNAAVNFEANAGEAASLYLARLQQGLKVPNSINMRVTNGAKKEFQKIALLNFKYHDSKKYNKVLDLPQEAIMKDDFNPEDCDIRTAADPSQGSDVERAQRASAVLELASTQTEQVINYREAMLNVLKEMKAPNLDKLAPEPDPNAVDPQMQLLMAEKAMEAEMRQEDQELRRGELQVKKAKAAKEAAEAMSGLGLASDKQEAEIQALYVQSLERMMKLGISSKEANNIVRQVEDTYIGDNIEGTRLSADNSSADGDMVEQPSDQGLSSVPGVVQ